jgi:hypothetical protein
MEVNGSGIGIQRTILKARMVHKKYFMFCDVDV